MPNRYVRASAIESEAVNALTPAAEVFYRRLINRVDDFGRFTANPALLRASLFPLQLDRVTEKTVGANLAVCASVGLIFTYESNGKKLLVMNKWENGRAKESDYAPPPADICLRMQTYVYTRKHKHTSAPDSDTDTDTGSDSDNKASLPFASPEFAAAWSDFCQHRHEIKKKLTPTATKQTFSVLAGWGESRAIAAIRFTIGKGWQGIREDDRAGSTLPAHLDRF